MCDLQETAGLILAPLPARKQLWEAGNAAAWKVEGDRTPGGDGSSFGLAANGDLVNLEVGGRPFCYRDTITGTRLSRSSANWAEWCSGMDGFGALVMLAASLIA